MAKMKVNVLGLLLVVIGMSSVESMRNIMDPEMSEIISKVNSGGHTWTAGVNKFAFMSAEERRSYIMNPSKVDINSPRSLLSTSEQKTQSFHSQIPSGVLPVKYDPRDQAWMTPARDQAWMTPAQRSVKGMSEYEVTGAFAPSSALADRRRKMGRETPVLSVQNILSCSSPDVYCCNGGFPYTAWNFMSTSGIVSESCFNYQSGGGTCTPANCPINPACPNGGNAMIYNGSNAEWLLSEFQTMYHLYNFGPLTMAMIVYGDFYSYVSGVYQHESGSEMGGHEVELIGWGEENGTPYWLVKNSWGTKWAEDGYFKIIRGNNNCGCEENYSSLLSGFPLAVESMTFHNVNPATLIESEVSQIALTGYVKPGGLPQSVNVSFCNVSAAVNHFGLAKYALAVIVENAPSGTSGTLSDGKHTCTFDSLNWNNCFLTAETELRLNVTANSSLSNAYFTIEAALSTNGALPDRSEYSVIYRHEIETEVTSLQVSCSLMAAPWEALVTAPEQPAGTEVSAVLVSFPPSVMLSTF